MAEYMICSNSGWLAVVSVLLLVIISYLSSEHNIHSPFCLWLLWKFSSLIRSLHMWWQILGPWHAQSTVPYTEQAWPLLLLAAGTCWPSLIPIHCILLVLMMRSQVIRPSRYFWGYGNLFLLPV
jgi:hypothetical protein